MQVKVIKDIRYAGRSYKPGDMVEMTDSHANTFTRLRKVMVPTQDPVPPPEAPRAKTYRRRDMVAEQPKAEPSPPPKHSEADEALHEPALQPPEEPLDLPPLPKKEHD